MLIEHYPVGWAVDAGKPEPIAVYLIDIPGIAMQGRTMKEAVNKLSAFAPAVLAKYRDEGAMLPAPSGEPNLRIAEIRMQWFKAVSPLRAGTSPAEVEMEAEMRVAYA